MTNVFDALDLLFTDAPDDPKAVYDHVAAQYDEFRKLWLHLAGGAVEKAMIADLHEILAPRQRILDAGCGTGAIARDVHAFQPDAPLTMLDLSPAMLDRATDIPGEHIAGSVLDLPFPENTFDIVVSAWVIETVSDPMQAVREYLRVIKTTGYVFYTFCSVPEGWFSRAGTALLREVVESRFAGHFLSPDETPWHDCVRSRQVRSQSGLTTYIALRKCCPIGPRIMPVPMTEASPDRRPGTHA